MINFFPLGKLIQLLTYTVILLSKKKQLKEQERDLLFWRQLHSKLIFSGNSFPFSCFPHCFVFKLNLCFKEINAHHVLKWRKLCIYLGNLNFTDRKTSVYLSKNAFSHWDQFKLLVKTKWNICNKGQLLPYFCIALVSFLRT